MLTPDDMEAMQDLAAAIAQPLNEYLITDICRRVKGAGAITDTAEYQIYRAEALGMAKKDIAKAVAEQLALSDEAVDALFDTVTERTAGGAGSEELRQLTAGYAKTTRGDLRALMKDLWAPDPTGRLYGIEDVYGRTMDFAVGKIMTGAADPTTAMRQACRQLADRGIRVLPNGPSGRSVSVEYSVRRYVRSRMGELHGAVSELNHDKMGADGWEISAHAACAPDHEPIQGRQFSDKEFKRINGALERHIGQFQCKHMMYPILLGKSTPMYTEAQLREMARRNAEGVTYQGRHYTLYEAGQERAAVENALRRDKLRCLADDALGDTEKLQTDQIKLNRLNEEYVRFCKATGQRTRNERLQVAGFGRSEAGRAIGTNIRGTQVFRMDVDELNRVRHKLGNDRIFERKQLGVMVHAREVTTTKHKMFLSTRMTQAEAKQAAKTISYYDKKISEVEKLLRYDIRDFTPPTYVLVNGSTEMRDNVIASFNARLNVIFLRMDLNTDEKMIAEQMLIPGYYACADDSRSSVLHEVIHWMQNESMQKGDARTTALAVDEKNRNLFDQLGRGVYNEVATISSYAIVSFEKCRFSEVSAEGVTYYLIMQQQKDLDKTTSAYKLAQTIFEFWR